MKFILASVIALILAGSTIGVYAFGGHDLFECDGTNEFITGINTDDGEEILDVFCEFVDFSEIEALIDSLTDRVTQNEFDISNNTADIQTVNGSLNTFVGEQSLNNTGQQIFLNSLDQRVTNNTDNLLMVNEEITVLNNTTFQTQVTVETLAEITVVQLISRTNAIEAILTALPEFDVISLNDTDDLDCEDVTFPTASQGWCPNGKINNFNITDATVNSTSVILTSIDGSAFSICGVPNEEQGSFIMVCGATPLDKSVLNYVVIN